MSHPDDELLSALLDGEAPSGDVAHVDGCGTCQARLDQLRHATALVSAAVTLPPAHRREASLAAAMRAADEPLRVAAITSLGRRIPNRSAARAATRKRNGGLSAAAVLLVALAVGGLVISQLGGDQSARSDNSSLAQGVDTAAGATGGAAADDSTTKEASGEATSSMLAASDLGVVDDIRVVSERSTTDLAARDDAAAAAMAYESLTCPPEATDEPVVWQATLTYEGVAAVATVRTRSSTTRVTEIRALADCSLLASQEFAPTTPR